MAGQIGACRFFSALDIHVGLRFVLKYIRTAAARVSISGCLETDTFSVSV